MTEPITIGIASLPEREKFLRLTLNSLAHQNAEINIALNNYKEVPKWLHDYKEIGIIKKAEIHDNSLGDAAKFLFQKGGYNLTCDDDIIYPGDYVRRIIHGIEKYKRKAIVSFHGKQVPKGKVKSFYSYTKNFHCRKTVRSDQQIHVPGTGLLGWHTDTIRFETSDFKIKNMADIWVGLKAQKKQVPVFVLAHTDKYFQVSQPKKTIWKEHHKNDRPQTDAINSREWKYFNL